MAWNDSCPSRLGFSFPLTQLIRQFSTVTCCQLRLVLVGVAFKEIFLGCLKCPDAHKSLSRVLKSQPGRGLEYGGYAIQGVQISKYFSLHVSGYIRTQEIRCAREPRPSR